MTTFSDLVNDVLLAVEGYGLDQGRAAFVTGAGITAADTTISVSSTDNLGEGLAEIGDELVYIQSVDDTASEITIAPDGRGYRGTTAAAHAANTRITMSPVFPRSLVKRKVNETIVGLWPTLWGEGTTTLDPNVLAVGYEMPAATEEVLSVDHEEDDITRQWGPVRRWRFDSNADTTDFTTGKALYIFQDVGTTGNLRVRYRKQPTELAADSDDLTATGLRSTARAVVVAGAVWRLVSSMDISRLKVSTAVVDQLDGGNPIGSAAQLAGFLRAVYERELADELSRLQVTTPPTIHYTG